MYSLLGARPVKSPQPQWTFPSGSKMSFGHLEYEKNVYDWQGSQIPYIGFDELTHFTEKQFFYMLTRNRSTCGVRPYVRATMNPDAASWVRKFIDWYIDPETGYAIEERCGVIRWFVRNKNKIIWADSREELKRQFPKLTPKSFTFIKATIEDNKILMQKDPDYLANLEAQDEVEKERLKNGNWNIMPAAGIYFKKHFFKEIDELPQFKRVVRCWDRAATEWKPGDTTDPDYSAGIKIGQTFDNKYVVFGIGRERYKASDVENMMINTAKQDGSDCTIVIFQDPGGAGKNEAEQMVIKLAGFPVVVDKVVKDKVTLAKPFATQVQHGNVYVWTGIPKDVRQDYYDELENFPDGSKDDQVDGSSGAFNELALNTVADFPDEGTLDSEDYYEDHADDDPWDDDDFDGGMNW